MTQKEAAKFLDLKPRTMEVWRYEGGAPPFVRVSSRCVRYRPADLDAWVEARVRTSTSDPGNFDSE
jgi:predicted DNA-binding transcriptional regulator AlpA